MGVHSYRYYNVHVYAWMCVCVSCVYACACICVVCICMCISLCMLCVCVACVCMKLKCQEIIHFSVFIPIHHSFGFSDIFLVGGLETSKTSPGSAPAQHLPISSRSGGFILFIRFTNINMDEIFLYHIPPHSRATPT